MVFETPKTIKTDESATEIAIAIPILPRLRQFIKLRYKTVPNNSHLRISCCNNSFNGKIRTKKIQIICLKTVRCTLYPESYHENISFSNFGNWNTKILVWKLFGLNYLEKFKSSSNLTPWKKHKKKWHKMNVIWASLFTRVLKQFKISFNSCFSSSKVFNWSTKSIGLNN